MSQPGHISRPRFGSGWVTRPLFGFFLAATAIALLFYSPVWFAGVTVVMTLFAAREWHRMVRPPELRAAADHAALHIQTAITGLSIALAMTALLLRFVPVAFVVLAVGAVAAFVVSQRRGDNPIWHAAGVLYLGLPALALAGLRVFPAQGAQIVLGMFLIIWATDTGALCFGKTIGGAKIAPRLSPGKTWSGTIGGSLTAALIFGLYIGFFGRPMLPAMAFALVFSVIAHGGDLFESWVKRRFDTKDSGSIIPGHGGVLDRMDSTFACSVVMALLVFVVHFNPMFGGHG
jgi:phosphatidate cytidylyltransferase